MTSGDCPRTALIVAAGSSGDAQSSLLTLAGYTIRQVEWSEAEDALDAALPHLLLLEAQDLSPDLLAAMLPAIAAAAAPDVPIVAVVDETRIDQVAAWLLGGRTQLLCNPSTDEHILALATASALGSDSGVTMVREDDRERPARLSAEVARIAEMLARLGRRAAASAAPDALADRLLGFEGPPLQPAETVDPAEIRRLIRARRLRDRTFGAGLFEDPAWDMMLDLFAAHLEETDVSVSSLCIAAAVAPTTALRWIGRLIDAGLFTRAPDPLDRRRTLMSLSRHGLQAMYAHVSTLRAQGLPLA
jgi:hypothetical protein